MAEPWEVPDDVPVYGDDGLPILDDREATIHLMRKEIERLRWMFTHELDGWHTGDPKEKFELVEFDYHPAYLADLERAWEKNRE